MNKSTFIISQMDCSAEEQLIRLKLEDQSQVKHLDFDLPKRSLEVYHTGGIGKIQRAIGELKLNEKLLETIDSNVPEIQEDKKQRTVLWWVLGVNLGFFVVEITAGWIAGSMGLVADSLDMLADAVVYGLSLMAVGAAIARKKLVAKNSGFIQLGLAVIGLAEVLRRFLSISAIPDSRWMIVVSVFAMAGNIICLWLINKAKSEDAHMQASAIFTSNDIIVNGGVIVAGAFVYWLNSKWPDLFVGLIIFAVVLRGAIRILKLSK